MHRLAIAHCRTKTFICLTIFIAYFQAAVAGANRFRKVFNKNKIQKALKTFRETFALTWQAQNGEGPRGQKRAQVGQSCGLHIFEKFATRQQAIE